METFNQKHLTIHNTKSDNINTIIYVTSNRLFVFAVHSRVPYLPAEQQQQKEADKESSTISKKKSYCVSSWNFYVM